MSYGYGQVAWGPAAGSIVRAGAGVPTAVPATTRLLSEWHLPRPGSADAPPSVRYEPGGVFAGEGTGAGAGVLLIGVALAIALALA